MAERCPLNVGELTHPIPEICRDQCADIYSDFRQTRSHKIDVYGDNPSNCATHESADLDTGSEDILAISETEREYVVVDECNDCSQEYRETRDIFECPYAGQIVDESNT